MVISATQLFIYLICMVERLYRRVQEVKRLWKDIKFKRKILTYKDKLLDEQVKGEKGNSLQ